MTGLLGHYWLTLHKCMCIEWVRQEHLHSLLGVENGDPLCFLDFFYFMSIFGVMHIIAFYSFFIVGNVIWLINPFDYFEISREGLIVLRINTYIHYTPWAFLAQAQL